MHLYQSIGTGDDRSLDRNDCGDRTPATPFVDRTGRVSNGEQRFLYRHHVVVPIAAVQHNRTVHVNHAGFCDDANQSLGKRAKEGSRGAMLPASIPHEAASAMERMQHHGTRIYFFFHPFRLSSANPAGIHASRRCEHANGCCRPMNPRRRCALRPCSGCRFGTICRGALRG